MKAVSFTSLALGMVMLATAAPAWAQQEGYEVKAASPGDRDYTVSFIDDPLDALPTSSYIARIQVRTGRVRTLLLRPRTSFVTEMLVSAEKF